MCRYNTPPSPHLPRNLVTFGSPHQGVFGVPECQAWVGDPVLGPALCELVRRLLNMGAYIPWIQVAAPPEYTEYIQLIPWHRT